MVTAMGNWVEIRVDIGELGRRARMFPLMEEQIEDMTPIWEDVAEAMRGRLEKTFADEGPGWQSLAPLTQALRRARGYGAAHPILVQTGALKRSLTVAGAADSIEDIQPQSLTFGTKIPYAAIHQHGTGRVPARPILQPEQLIRVISRAIADHVTTETRRAARKV